MAKLPRAFKELLRSSYLNLVQIRYDSVNAEVVLWSSCLKPDGMLDDGFRGFRFSASHPLFALGFEG